MENEDPTAHLTSFLNICDTSKPAGLTQDSMRRMLFLFSLRGQALNWFTSSGCAVLETFGEMISKFTAKYYPPSKIEKLRHAVENFKQMEGESVTESWERFNELCRKCPGLVGEDGYELQKFYK